MIHAEGCLEIHWAVWNKIPMQTPQVQSRIDRQL